MKALEVESVAACGGSGRVEGGVSGLEIAVVSGERKLMTIHVSDQVWHAGSCLDVRIGEVTPEPDGIRLAFVILVAVLILAEAIGRKSSGGCDEQDGDGDTNQFPRRVASSPLLIPLSIFRDIHALSICNRQNLAPRWAEADGNLDEFVRIGFKRKVNGRFNSGLRDDRLRLRQIGRRWATKACGVCF